MRKRLPHSEPAGNPTDSNKPGTALVTHDIGNMVGYTFAAQFPKRVTRWVVIDAPLSGIGPWDEIIRSPALWHFNFRGPDAERLEPISKSSEEDNEAGELDKTEEVLSVILPADEDATLPLYPSEEALDQPAPHVTA